MKSLIHEPVLKKEVLGFLDLKLGKVVIDGTLGLGGHAKEILKIVGEKGRLIGFDQDEENLMEAKKRLKEFKNVNYVHSNFENLEEMLSDIGIDQADAVFLDLGISSPHVDLPERGFSFQKEGPLDMRFDKRNNLTAEKIVNDWPEKELRRIFWKYGEEKRAPRFAREIVSAREESRIETTIDLATVCEKVKILKKAKHPATQVFQALRIVVNRELEVLETVLDQAFRVLKNGGRMVVISYHSLEDRIVKNFFRDLAKYCICPKEEIVCVCRGKALVKILTKKPIGPGEEELVRNPRARSAKMRVIEKL